MKDKNIIMMAFQKESVVGRVLVSSAILAHTSYMERLLCVNLSYKKLRKPLIYKLIWNVTFKFKINFVGSILKVHCFAANYIVENYCQRQSKYHLFLFWNTSFAEKIFCFAV